MQKKTELSEQQAVIDWCVINSGRFPELKTIYHIPNEGKRSRIGGRELRSAGLKAGVPDLCLPVSRGGWNALYIEMKLDKTKKCSKEQIEFQKLLKQFHNGCVVAYGADEAISYLRQYLAGDIEIYD